jgi:hypothetical protein
VSQDPTTGSVLIPGNGDFVFDGGYAEDDPQFKGGAPVASPEVAEVTVVRELTTVVSHDTFQTEQIPQMPYRTTDQLEAANLFHLSREADARERQLVEALVGQANFMSAGVTHWRTEATKAEKK